MSKFSIGKILVYTVFPLAALSIGIAPVSAKNGLAVKRAESYARIEKAKQKISRKKMILGARTAARHRRWAIRRAEKKILPAPAIAPVAWVNPPAAAPSAPAVTLSGQIGEIAAAINAERRVGGLSEVKINDQLNAAAAAKARDMAEKNYFAHTSPEGINDWFFINQSGYRYSAAGANLAKGNFGGNAGVVTAWMQSPGHRANIMADFGQEIGLGRAGDIYVMFIAKPL